MIVWQRRDGTRIELDGDRLRTLRLAGEWTQADVAEHIGCTSAAVSSWETETRCPSLPQIDRIVDLFGAKLSRTGAIRVTRGWVAEEENHLDKRFQERMDDPDAE